MSLNVTELTTYIKEVQRARNALDKLRDFVDLMNKDNDKVEADLESPANKIKDTFDNISLGVNDLDKIFNSELNKMTVSEEEVADAAQKLILYHGDAMQLLIWSEQQKVHYSKDSYWWKYWQGISDKANEEVAKGGNPLGKTP